MQHDDSPVNHIFKAFKSISEINSFEVIHLIENLNKYL